MRPPLSDQRKFLSPEPGDDWKTIAARLLPDTPIEDAIQRLKSWNLHLLARMPAGEFTGSDVLFTEPPREQGMSMLGDVDMSGASGIAGG